MYNNNLVNLKLSIFFFFGQFLSWRKQISDFEFDSLSTRPVSYVYFKVDV